MDNIIFERCSTDAVTATDLAREIEQAHRDGTTVEAYRLTELDNDGYRKTVTGMMLYFPGIGRAGIEWGADANWTDAASPEDALHRYTTDQMQA